MAVSSWIVRTHTVYDAQFMESKEQLGMADAWKQFAPSIFTREKSLFDTIKKAEKDKRDLKAALLLPPGRYRSRSPGQRRVLEYAERSTDCHNPPLKQVLSTTLLPRGILLRAGMPTEQAKGPHTFPFLRMGRLIERTRTISYIILLNSKPSLHGTEDCLMNLHIKLTAKQN